MKFPRASKIKEEQDRQNEDGEKLKKNFSAAPATEEELGIELKWIWRKSCEIFC
jgi:hypothetical protein